MNNQKLNYFFPLIHLPAFLTGIVFLIIYWGIGYDGITFSDDVYYLLAGKKFWEGDMQVNEYHFSSRWGAYIPSGLIGHLLGFEPHRISLISLLSYTFSFFLLIRTLPKNYPAWVLTLWFCTQVYFLHFLTKVYPDSLLVLFTCLIPVAATQRNTRPILAGFVLVLSLFLGFLTKETIVLLAPFPALLFIYDFRKKHVEISFYNTIMVTGIILLSLYLCYFWVNFGDPMYRINSIHAGHYISAYSYADKGFGAILKRLTVIPISNFVDRSYWTWMVFALPGILLGLKSKVWSGFEFSLAFLCLLVGFWFMSSSLEFYNPIYLNPRHLIIFIPILAMLIALGWYHGVHSYQLKKWMAGLLLFGVIISLFSQDLKMAAFNFALAILAGYSHLRFQPVLVAICLIAPACLAIPYQQKLKQYPFLIKTLSEETDRSVNETFLITNNFLEFSEQVLFPENPTNQVKMRGLDAIMSWEKPKFDTVTMLLYSYYLHAYPLEEKEIDRVLLKLNELGYELAQEENKGVIQKYIFLKPNISETDQPIN
ncbi:hypothetical protein LZF95_15800 [Algoriphagus sp. AGSA1]|uniref:ArnT family glycosyltransferase n=1 Tax=Algoriphagus sp. AGSA1 TaxID=2907213 RepID=UPI001F435837|nr:hypothetical protein [Algoriphagus sp. AGSA1]MCE7056147.1 hypothetical protein [Algoriphagus sp. AGSA1]